MLQLVAPMRFLHERYFGRPSCPKCGEPAILPEHPEFSECRGGNEIRNFWVCDNCDNRFATLIKLEPGAA